jgi:uncharacterized membrane protein
MNYILKNFVLPGIILLALDFIYISATKPMFESQIIEIQRVAMNIKLPGAIACYAFLIFGLYYFILRNRRPVFEAVLLGLVIYGVYETTSYALLKKWRPSIMMLDTLWGGVLFGLTTAIVYEIK